MTTPHAKHTLNPKTQIRNQSRYDDTKTPSLAEFERLPGETGGPETLADDFDNLISALRRMLQGTGGNWYDTIISDRGGAAAGLNDIVNKRIITSIGFSSSVVTGGGSSDFWAGGLLPTKTLAIVGENATDVDAYVAGLRLASPGTLASELVTDAYGNIENLVQIIDNVTGEQVENGSGQPIYAALTALSGEPDSSGSILVFFVTDTATGVHTRETLPIGTYLAALPYQDTLISASRSSFSRPGGATGLELADMFSEHVRVDVAAAAGGLTAGDLVMLDSAGDATVFVQTSVANRGKSLGIVSNTVSSGSLARIIVAGVASIAVLGGPTTPGGYVYASTTPGKITTITPGAGITEPIGILLDSTHMFIIPRATATTLPYMDSNIFNIPSPAKMAGGDAFDMNSGNLSNVGNIATATIDINGNQVTDFLDEDDMASNNATAVASQQSIKAFTFAHSRVIFVASDSQYTTISAGLAAASALTPTVANPVVVTVAPGTYPEDSLVIPSDVVLRSHCYRQSIIDAPAATATILTMSARSQVHGISLINASGIGGVGIDISAAGDFAINDCFTSDCETGLNINNATASVRLRNFCSTRSGVTDPKYGVRIQAGSVDMYNVVAEGSLGNTFDVAGIMIEGANSHAHIFDIIIEYCDSGIYVNNGGEAHIFSADVDDCVYGLRIGGTGTTSKCFASSIEFENSTIWDVWLEPTDLNIELYSGRINQSKIATNLVIPSDSIKMAYQNTFPGAQSWTVQTEVHVGTHLHPKKSSFGGGDSYVLGMKVFSNTNLAIGTWADHTAEASSSSGSTFNSFPGIIADNCLYFGGDVQFPGLKINTTVAIALGAGAVVLEYWNGVAWTAFNYMATKAASKYFPYAETIYGRVQFEHVLFNQTIVNDWAQTLLNGENKYWVRARISTGITTAATIEQVKLHSNRFEVNLDGYTQYFGTGRPVGLLPWAINDARAFGNSPANQDLFALNSTGGASQDLAVGRIENLFQSGLLDKVGFALPLPHDLDTSMPITVEWSWINTDVSAGDVLWRVNAGLTQVGDPVAATILAAPTTIRGEISVDALVTIAAASNNLQRSNSASVAINDAVSRRVAADGDVLWMTFARVGNNVADTYLADCAVIALRFIYTKWNNGGYVL